MYPFLTKIIIMSQSAFSSIYIKSSRDLNTILRGGTHCSTQEKVLYVLLSLSASLLTLICSKIECVGRGLCYRLFYGLDTVLLAI